MSILNVYARLCALIQQQAYPMAPQRNTPISENPLILLPLQLAGESPALLGIGVARLDGALTVFSCPRPANRDHQYETLAQFASHIADHLQEWAAQQGGMPQIICTGDAAAMLLLTVFDRMAYVSSEYSLSEIIRPVGRALYYFNRRFERSDSAAMLPVAKAFVDLYATGQDPYGDTHLGALAEWIKPDDGNLKERVREAECRPASVSTDPADDKAILIPALAAYNEAFKAGQTTAVRVAARTIHLFVTSEIRRRHGLLMSVLRAVLAIPSSACAAAVHAADKTAYAPHYCYSQTDEPLPRRHRGNASLLEYLYQDRAHEEFEVRALAPQSVPRAEAKLKGEVLHGTVSEVRTGYNGRKKIVEFDFQTTQQLTPHREGHELALLDNPAKIKFRVLSVEQNEAGMLVSLRMTDGVTKDRQWPRQGDEVDIGRHIRFSLKAKNASERLKTMAVHPVVSGPPTRRHNYLSAIKRMEEST